MDQRDDQVEREREPYETPELSVLATVEDATLSVPETIGADAFSQMSN